MVLSVSDGDTLSAVVIGTPEKIRLTGIHCPEHDQPFAKEATQLAKQLALEKDVRVTETGRDKCHRILGEVVLPNGGCSIASWAGRESVGGIESMRRQIQCRKD